MRDSDEEVGPTILPDDAVPPIGFSRAVPHDDPDPWPRIDGFEIRGLIDDGGEGWVYHARETFNRREVALKVIKGSGIVSPTAADRFSRQMELAGRLDHANIVRVFQVGVSPCFYFSMTLVKGGTKLNKFIAARQPGVPEKLRLFLKVCGAVASAHREKVVHLDLKPDNILVGEKDALYVLDFGLAMDLSPQGGWEYLVGAGTPAYMSPEQASGSLTEKTARASDVYSLGVILYELLTGRLPRDIKGEKSEMVRRAIDDPILPPLAADPRLPDELAALLERALAADPRERYQSVDELARDVGNYLEQKPLEAVIRLKNPKRRGGALRPGRPTRPALYVLRKRVRRHRLALAVVAAVLAVVAFPVIWSWLRVRDVGEVARSRGEDLQVSRHQDELHQADLQAARRQAGLTMAELAVSQGDLSARSGKWEQARESYRQARDLFAGQHEPATAADLRIWDAFRRGPPPLSVIRGAAGVTDVALMADGRRAVTTSSDGRVRLWDLPGDAEIGPPVETHGGMILNVATASDADLALVGGDDSTARLIDLAARKVTATLRRGDGWVTRVALSRDGRRALTVAVRGGGGLLADEGGELSTWSLPDGALRSSARSDGRVVCAAFSPDGSVVATGGDGLSFRDASTLAALPRAAGAGRVLSLAFSPDGEQLATGGGDSFLRLWDVATGGQVFAVPTGAPTVNAVAFSRDGRTIFSTGNDGVSQTWNRSTGAQSGGPALALGAEVTPARQDSDSKALDSAVLASVFRPDGGMVARVGGDGIVRIWATAPPVEVRRMAAADASVRDVGLLSEGRLVLAATERGLRLWDQATGEPLAPPRAPAPVDSADAMALDAGGDRLAVVSGDTLLLLDARTWGVIARAGLNRRPGSPAVLAFAPDGTRLVCPGAGFDLSVRDGRDLKEIGRLVGHTAPVLAAAFSPVSGRVLSGGRDGAVCLWDADTMRRALVMTGHADAVRAVAFSPDGSRAFSAGGGSDAETSHKDFDVRQWDLGSGRCVRRFTGGRARVRALALSPRDGAILACASDDNTVRLWQTTDGRELATLTGHTAPVVAVRFAADGGSILSAGEDLAVLRWDLDAPRRRDDLKDPPGERFAFMGLDAWAVDRLGADRAAGKQVSHLTLARCFWKLGRTSRAVEEMKAAMDQGEAPRDYLNLCVRSLESR